MNETHGANNGSFIGSEPRSPESNFRLLIALLIVVLVLLVLILVLGYFVYKKYKVRKQHENNSLRVEYTTAADDEVWIPPGPPRDVHRYAGGVEMSSRLSSYGSVMKLDSPDLGLRRDQGRVYWNSPVSTFKFQPNVLDEYSDEEKSSIKIQISRK